MADDFDFILKDLSINVNAAVRRAAVEIGEEIQNEYEIAITKFYSDFDPNMYDRTYSLYEGSKGVGGLGVYQRQLSKNMYECGINVGPENYSYNPYVKPYPHGLEMDPSIVFPKAWDSGIHGFTSYTVNMQHKNASKDKYWKIKRKSIPKKSSPPKKIMDVAFKKIDNQGHCEQVIIKHMQGLGGL